MTVIFIENSLWKTIRTMDKYEVEKRLSCSYLNVYFTKSFIWEVFVRHKIVRRFKQRVINLFLLSFSAFVLSLFREWILHIDLL